ncbi:uncharacterized protein LOC122852978 [Aphidius gifuensis]|uniref:uncharacterized protein LOC122852978 n=1 Tax=Aphidius gifuensis TaxID=684658 RepID=UPI001CDBDDDA|nr:uncharacterized protein LOC122852978 [Aphidius gifuensis]
MKMESRKTRLYSNCQPTQMRKPNIKNILLSRSNELSNTCPFISFFHGPTKSEFASQPETPVTIKLIPKESETKNTEIQWQHTTDSVEQENIETSVKNSSESRVKNRKTTRSIFKQALEAVVQQVESEKAKTNNVPIVNSSVPLFSPDSSVSPAPRFCLNDKINHQDEKNKTDCRMDSSTTTITKMNSQYPKAHELTKASKILDENKNEVDDLIKKISCVINDYPSGVFEHQLPVYYKQRYNEKLTKSWVKLIDQMDLKMEPSVGSFNIIIRK